MYLWAASRVAQTRGVGAANHIAKSERVELVTDEPMALSTKAIHDIYYDVASETRKTSAVAVVRRMLIESLAPNRKRVYECIYDSARKGITAREIADKLKISIQSAGNATKELYQLDLLTRQDMHGENGLYYIYQTFQEK